MSSPTDLLLKIVDNHVLALRKEMLDMRQASEDRHVEIMRLIEQGFPDGDLKSHYQYHMRLIEEASAKRAIKLEVWKKLIAGSVWSALAFLFFKLVEYAREYIRF